MLRNLVAGRVVVFEHPHGIILVENLVVCQIYFCRVLCTRNLRRAKHRHQDEGSRILAGWRFSYRSSSLNVKPRG